MKTRYWVILLFCLVAVCAGFTVYFAAPASPSSRAEIRSRGELVQTIDLDVNQEFTVTDTEGSNVITVRDSRIAVTWADCPDGYCVDRGFCNSGAQIVCLPHGLVITFVDEAGIDFAVG